MDIQGSQNLPVFAIDLLAGKCPKARIGLLLCCGVFLGELRVILHFNWEIILFEVISNTENNCWGDSYTFLNTF